MDKPATDNEETAEHMRPIELDIVIYDPVFNIVLKLISITERGTAVWEMLDHAEGNSESEE